MENALAILVTQAVERKYGLNPNKRRVAQDCAIKYSALVDVMRGHVKRPGEEVLEGLSDGIGVDYDTLALAAYGRMPKPVSEPATSPRQLATAQ